MGCLELFCLKGKTAVVTGAGGLLGAYHCRALAEAGARVIVTDITSEACQAVVRDIGESAFACETDVTDPEAVKNLLATAQSVTGGIDVLINNAAVNDIISVEGQEKNLDCLKFENYPLESWKRSLDVNVTGVFLCSQIIGGRMAEVGSGSIINIASTYGIVAPDQSLYQDREGHQQFYKSAVYPTTKGAILSLTRFLAAYWGSAGVRVNTLSPGGVENAQDDFFIDQYSQRTPLKRMAVPSDYMGALVYLASDASAYMTGANLVVDGGFTVW